MPHEILNKSLPHEMLFNGGKVFNLLGAIRTGSTFWGIWAGAITRIFLVEHLSKSGEMVH